MKNHNTELEFRKLMLDAGFKTLTEFSEAVGVNQSNIGKNIRQEAGNKVQLDRLFKYANTLGVSIEVLLWMFYEDEMRKNEKAVAKNAL